MITAILLFDLMFVVPLAVIIGMAIEWRSGRMDHWIRQVAPPVSFPTLQPVRPHEDYIDDCDQFNRAVIKAAFDKTLFAEPGRVQ